MSRPHFQAWDERFAIRLCLELVNSGAPLDIGLSEYLTSTDSTSDAVPRAIYAVKLLPQSQVVAHLLGIHEHFVHAPSYSQLVRSTAHTLRECPVILDVIIDLLIDGYLESHAYLGVYALTHLLQADMLVEVNTISQALHDVVYSTSSEGHNQNFLQFADWLGKLWLPRSGLIDYILSAQRVLRSAIQATSTSEADNEEPAVPNKVLTEADGAYVDYDAISTLYNVLATRFNI